MGIEIDINTWYPTVTHEVETGCGDFYITILLNHEGTRPIYLIPQLSKAGGCAIEKGVKWLFGLRSTHLSSFAESANKVFAIDDIGERLYQYHKLNGTTCQYGDMCCLHQIAKMLFHYDLELDKESTIEDEED